MYAKIFFFSISLSITALCYTQTTKNVLFLGNSYTGVNNLPQMVYNVAFSAGDTVVYDSNTPGGHTFQQHVSNTTSINKIKQGNWDFVVLQEQSQLPSFPINQVETQCFPYAAMLNDSILKYNPCAETVFYMTWGRKNGDAGNCASFPPLCTYEGMDSLLHLRYMMMTDSNEAIVSPVGAVWHYIRTNYPTIELYQADESHPSLAGSYAAACTFYTTIFRENPLSITNDYGLNATDALNIRNAVKTIVFDALINWNVGKYDVLSGFSYTQVTTLEVSFQNSSVNANSFLWNFGDGQTSTQANPTHNFASEGSYNVKLIVSDGCTSDSIQKTVIVGQNSIEKLDLQRKIEIYPNPVTNTLFVKAESIKEIHVFNLLGKSIPVETKINEDAVHIDFSAIPAGVYFVKIVSNNTKTTKRIVKQ